VTPPPSASATATRRRPVAATAPARSAAATAPARRPVAPDVSPALQVVDAQPRRRRVRRRRLVPALSMALVVGSLMAAVVGHAVLAQGQVRLTAAQTSLAAAQAGDRQATLKVARLEAPARIAGEASQGLHMEQSAQIAQLPYVPLDKPLPTPDVRPAPQGTAPATSSAAPASTTGT
jgi:hypothetical protein